MTIFTEELKILSFHEQVEIMVLGKLPLGKLLPVRFPRDNSHPKNSHLGKFSCRITPTQKIPPQKIPTQDNSHLEISHPG